MPEASITVMNIKITAIWWHACTRPTATRGHRIPPNRAIELANPTPVALTAVGYICKEHGLKRQRCSEVSDKVYVCREAQAIAGTKPHGRRCAEQ